MKTCLLSFAISLLLPVSAYAQQSAAQVSMPGVSDKPIYQAVTPIQPNHPGGVVAPHAPETAPAGGPVASPSMAVPAPSAGTASEQGYVDSGPTLSAWDLETLRNKTSARQQGDKAEVFARSRGVGSSVEDAAWLRAWETKLAPLGVHPDKIKFEAARLTKEQFGRWASRQAWAVEEGLIKP
jgi:hypothetical protein